MGGEGNGRSSLGSIHWPAAPPLSASAFPLFISFKFAPLGSSLNGRRLDYAQPHLFSLFYFILHRHGEVPLHFLARTNIIHVVN